MEWSGLPGDWLYLHTVLGMQSRVVALLVSTALTCSAEVEVRGLVRAAEDGAPVAGARVLAIEEGERAIASATTDAQGWYVLVSPAERFELTVHAKGRYVAEAGEVRSDRVARSCGKSGECVETNFVLSRGTVVEGWIWDKYGNPLATVELELETATDGPAPPKRGPISPMQERNRTRRTVSDDRGYYRFWGVRPGSYRLVRQRNLSRFPGIPEGPEIDEAVKIAPGERVVTVDVQLTDPPTIYTISGVLEGVAEDDPRWITLEPLDGGDRQTVYVQDGKFTHPTPEGRWVARLEHVINADPAAHDADVLATLTVDRDLTDLRLRPQPPSGVRVRAEFVDGTPNDFRLQLRPTDRPEAQPRTIQLTADGTEVARGGLLPGDYRMRLLAGDYYLVESSVVSVFAGQLTDVTLRLSNIRTILRGRVRFPIEAGARRGGAGDGGDSRQTDAIGADGRRGRVRLRSPDSGRVRDRGLGSGGGCGGERRVVDRVGRAGAADHGGGGFRNGGGADGRAMRLLVLTLVAGAVVAQTPDDAGALVRGQVLDAQTQTQAPVSGATVRIFQSGGESYLFESDVRGRFQWEEAAPGTYRSTVLRSGYERLAMEVVEIAADEEELEIILEVQRSSVIAGRVFDADGRPLVAATVVAYQRETNLSTFEPYWANLYNRSGFAHSFYRGMTNDRGEYRFWGLTRGEYVLFVRPSTMPGAASELQLEGAPTFYPEQPDAGRGDAPSA